VPAAVPALPDPPSAAAVRLLGIRDAPLSVDEALAAVADPAAGGVAVFVGAVRDEDEGRTVTSLDYAAHPGALAALRAVAERVAADYPACGVAAVHRVGRLAVGDLAVVVAVSCPHRAEAFEAARRLIDELKAQVPIWKRQTFADGEAAWVGAP
jgi:molybdopterin synthase catalytic subunit